MTLTIRSHSKSIAEIEGYVKGLFDQFSLDHELYPNVLISLTEAVNNAIVHGNNGDHSKHVHVETSFRTDKLICVIMDEGSGFDFANLPDPTDPAHIENPGGRGVFLMQQLSDDVRFNNNGSRVELEFVLGSE